VTAAVQPNSLRLFVAIGVPQSVKAALQTVQAELRASLSRARVSWAKVDQFHLTLQFLGDIETDRLEPLTHVLREACRAFGAIQLRSSQVGVFPNLRAPRVIWAGVLDRDQTLPQLAKALAVATQPFTKEPPKENFAGHITLGRIKFMSRDEAGVLAKRVSSLAESAFGEWAAERIELMKSELSSAGANHEIVESLELRGAMQ
jgi:RNA 2',3'-cyclic 3'-phosphodiesterase